MSRPTKKLGSWLRRHSLTLVAALGGAAGVAYAAGWHHPAVAPAAAMEVRPGAPVVVTPERDQVQDTVQIALLLVLQPHHCLVRHRQVAQDGRAARQHARSFVAGPAMVQPEIDQPASSTPRPDDGSQPRVMANVSWTIRPSQKVGIDTPAAATAVIERSTLERCVTAATIPAGMAAETASTSDATSNSSDAGRRSTMRSSTGRPSLKL